MIGAICYDNFGTLRGRNTKVNTDWYLSISVIPLLACGGFLKGDGVGLAVIGEEVLPLGFEC